MTHARSIRKLFPPSGAAYELFDAAVFLLGLAVLGYIISSPTPTQEKALNAPLDLLPDYVWGSALALVSVTAIVCAYRPHRVRLGYLAMIMACVFWSANFGVGMAFGIGSTFLPFDYLDAYEVSPRTLISVLLYGWIASRLIRDIPQEIEA